MIDAVHPYLNFPGNTEEAFPFYQSVFGGELHLTRFGDFRTPWAYPPTGSTRSPTPPCRTQRGTRLMATDAVSSMGQEYTKKNDFSITLDTSTADDAERLFEALVEGGAAEMPLAPTPWAEKYGMLRDRFGVRWMIHYQGDVEFTPDRTE